MAVQIKQTTDEKIREAIKSPLRSEVSTSDIVAGFISSTKLEEIVYDIKQLINSEVLSALEELEGEAVENVNGVKVIGIHHLESIKNRYKEL